MERLCIPFEIVHPEIDEGMRPYETPHALITKLSEEKAYAHSSYYKSHLIIGSDQIVYMNDEFSSHSNNLNIFSSLVSIKLINRIITAKPKNKKLPLIN